MPARRTVQPPARVCAAFGAAGTPTLLEGGQGSSWRVGDLVLKPADLSEAELAWQCDVFGRGESEEFRVAIPCRSDDGSTVVDGWCARPWLEGTHRRRRWRSIVDVGGRLHASLTSVPRPCFLDHRTDAWAVGDRVAWGELSISDYSHVKHMPRLMTALRPIEAESQLIHGDLTGNVLFADGLPPAIIDFSPYWRPPGFAAAIVVGDALLWEEAEEDLPRGYDRVPFFNQYLVRALIYRAVTDRLSRADEPLRPDGIDPFAHAVDIACRLAPPD